MHSSLQGIVSLLSRLYEEIRVREIAFGLSVSGQDFRPRIEYFQDAVRALTSDDKEAREKGGRLSVEFLAYDISALRYLHSMPLAPLNPGHLHLSPYTHLATTAPNAVASAPKKPGRAEKQELAEAYRQYAVLYSALFKPVADEDYRDRIEEMSAEAQELASVLGQVEALGMGKGSEQGVRTASAHCEDKEVRALTEGLLAKKQYKNGAKLEGAMKALKGKVNQADRSIAGLEAAHMQYATAQLGIYEAGKDIVKQLAGKGLNLAGQFVEASIQTQGPKGRGR